MGPVIVIAILLAFGYVFLIRPARRRTRSHEAMQTAIMVGDEIISAGGIHGIVAEAGENELRVEIAPSVVVTLDRRAVAAVAVLEEPDEEPHEPDETEERSGPEPGAEAEPDAS
jgi:preprotein translocase subunit YajC